MLQGSEATSALSFRETSCGSLCVSRHVQVLLELGQTLASFHPVASVVPVACAAVLHEGDSRFHTRSPWASSSSRRTFPSSVLKSHRSPGTS